MGVLAKHEWKKTKHTASTTCNTHYLENISPFELCATLTTLETPRLGDGYWQAQNAVYVLALKSHEKKCC